MSRRMIAVLSLVACTACLPVLVGGLIMKSSKSNAEKRAFITQIQTTNMERERLGLKPLDVCSEKYKFDPGWAAEDPVCLDRIKRYQAGDSTALDMTTSVPATTPRDSSPAPGPPPAAKPPQAAAFSP